MKSDPIINHSAAIVLAIALKKLYPDIRLAKSVLIDEGFYYDFATSEIISINDFAKIEKQMKKIIAAGMPFEKYEVDSSEAIKLFSGNKYKIEQINEINDKQSIKLCKVGDFTDLCSSDNLEHTGKLKSFKLLNLSGSYWQADANNDQLFRIYGVAFENDSQLNEYLELLEERKQSDHRKIGKDLKLFTFNQLAGQGLPIWLPAGTKIKYEIQKYVNKIQHKYGFEPVMTPVLGSVDLYKTSGHWDHYRDCMFPEMKIDNEELVLRPMTCPHHILVYRNDLHSYRDLPLRLCEHSLLHRYEASGGLTGLERVREMVLEDTHIFCKDNQIKQEVLNCYNAIKEIHEGLGSKIWRVDLSVHDPEDKEKFHGNSKMWEFAESQLEEALKMNNIDFHVMKGEAAFYGPKIDFQVKTTLGHVVTISTIQLDFLLPERFELTFKNENGEASRPVMIHLGLIGTYERYLAMLLEQTKGILPVWLAPTQIIILPVNDKTNANHTNELYKYFNDLGFRVEIDNRDERLSKRIRDAQVSKIPYQLIIGDEEIKSNDMITYRQYGNDESFTISKQEFVKLLYDKINSHQ